MSRSRYQQALAQISFAVQAVDELVDVLLHVDSADAVEGAEDVALELGDDQLGSQSPTGAAGVRRAW